MAIIQGDNAGPHSETDFVAFLQVHCALKSYHWEPQAPQMPHMNNLDLSVFPAMSKRHTAMGRKRGGLRVLTGDEIWETAWRVWEELPSSKIASGFIQAYRIAAEVIKHRGSNAFLGTCGTPHVGIRRDFKETATGLTRRDGKVFGPP